MEDDDGNLQYTRSEDAFVAPDGKGGQRESFIIAKAGKPIGKLVPLDEAEKPKKRPIGFMDGQFTVPADFDTMMADEIEEMFYGNPDKFKDV
jgi:antitoxin (DNA-binding transcriptional repressor) of toxin-antitoxin stability system